MPKDKIKIERIKRPETLQVTYCKRRKGLVKKAEELVTLCNAQVGLIMFSAANRLTTYGHPSLDAIIERRTTDQDTVDKVLQVYDRLRKEHDDAKLIVSQMEGEQLENLSIEELDQLAERLENSLSLVKAQRGNCENIGKTIVGLQHAVGDDNVANKERAPKTVLPLADKHGEDNVDLSSMRLDLSNHGEDSLDLSLRLDLY